MKAVFENKKISGILGILPEKTYYYDAELKNALSDRNQKIKKNMGYNQRYRAKKDTTASQLYIYGLNYLLDNRLIKREEIGAVLVISFTPDYFVPQMSNQIQAGCDLSKDILAVDIWKGCSGYISGILEALMVLDDMGDKKVLLFTGEVINRDMIEGELYDEPPYGGDGASITILENCKNDSKIYFELKTDGNAERLVTMKSGAFYDLFHKTNSKVLADPAASFRFFQMNVPEVVRRVLSEAGETIETIDHFFFIQANSLAARTLTETLKIPYDKSSMDLVTRYGDMSATLNPISVVDYYGNRLLRETHKIMICGYGSGVEWGAIILDIGNLDVCRLINSEF